MKAAFSILVKICLIMIVAVSCYSQTTLDYSNFSIIGKRNIFDPNRGEPIETRIPSTNFVSFFLRGTMYDKMWLSFFDSKESQYQKALKINDIIAGYTVKNITHTNVTLSYKTNLITMGIGGEMIKPEEGNWRLK